MPRTSCDPAVTWHQCTYMADGKSQGLMQWFFLLVFLFLTFHTSRWFHTRANASFSRESQKEEWLTYNHSGGPCWAWEDRRGGKGGKGVSGGVA